MSGWLGNRPSFRRIGSRLRSAATQLRRYARSQPSVWIVTVVLLVTGVIGDVGFETMRQASEACLVDGSRRQARVVHEVAYDQTAWQGHWERLFGCDVGRAREGAMAPPVNFDQWTVLTISSGFSGSPGHVNVKRILGLGPVLLVLVEEDFRDYGRGAATIAWHPHTVVLIPKTHQRPLFVVYRVTEGFPGSIIGAPPERFQSAEDWIRFFRYRFH